MTKRHARVDPPAPAALPTGAVLGEIIAGGAQVLGASAIAAGLWKLRPRSSPDRLISEASSFARFLAGALAPEDAAWLGRQAAAEVRVGSLASANPGEIGPIFAVWKRVLRAYLPSVGKGAHETATLAALARMKVEVATAAEAWSRERLDVVVVGASAGGVEALARLLGGIQAGAPVTLAIVQHVGATDRGFLPAILARQSRLAIAAAVDGAKLFLGHVYIAPPGRHLVVTPDCLRLVDGPPVHFVKPAADVLFESAAEAFGRRAASIVLSGTGRDGAAGTYAIHEHGGLTLCQDPEGAEFRGMPEAAIATGRVERKLSLRQLIGVLEAAVMHGRSGSSQYGRESA